MKEWLHGLLFEYDSFGGLIFNYFRVFILIVIIFFLLKIFTKIDLIKIISEKLSNLLKNETKNKIKDNKNFIQWFIGFIIIISIWINWNDPFNDFMLLTKGIEVEGIIINSKQESEIVEINNGRENREEFKFTYSYKYQTKDGNKYDGIEEVKGEQPEEFYSLEEEPIEVKVTYLESNPKYSRVFEYTTNNKNLYEWFRYTILYLIIFMSIWSLPFLSKKKK
jgi:hypothetical protein